MGIHIDINVPINIRIASDKDREIETRKYQKVSDPASGRIRSPIDISIPINFDVASDNIDEQGNDKEAG